jgi:hypothetical protein
MLTLRRFDREESAMVDAAVAKHADDPVKLASLMYDLVVKLRPDLTGCVIWYIGVDAVRQMWQFGVSHQSLPIHSLYEHCAEQPLIPR